MIALHNASAQSIAVTNRLSNLGYSGEHFDAKAAQQYLRARFYNPANGRFNRLDPFAGNMEDPQSLHKYAYVHGDPIRNSDPSGKFSVASMSSALAIGNVVRSVYNDAAFSAGSAAAVGQASSAIGEDFVFTFQDEMETAADDAFISMIPIIGTIYDVVQLIGAVSSILAGYFGSTILKHIATASNWLTSTISGQLTGNAQSSRSFSGARVLSQGLNVGKNAKAVFRYLKQRNVAAVYGRRIARSFPKADVNSLRPYKDKVSSYDSLPQQGGYRYYAEAHHLNQDAAFKHLNIASGDGISLPLAGSKNQPGTPHYEMHYSLDTFWDMYRPGGPLHGISPTLEQYDSALRVALRHAGYTKKKAEEIADIAKKDWQHLPATTEFPVIPGPTVARNHTLGGQSVVFVP